MPEIGLLQEAMAARALQFGALGIGENHEESHGRALAIRLISAGHVRNLFVELSNSAYGAMVQRATEHADQGYDAVRRELAVGGLHVCPISLDEVIATAISHRIPVHCADHYRAMQIGFASTPTGMRLRNNHVAQRVKDETDTDRAREGGAQGSLLLFGGAHFEGSGSLITYYPDLQWIKAG